MRFSKILGLIVAAAASALAPSSAKPDVPREPAPQVSPGPLPMPIPRGPLARKLPDGQQFIEVKMPESAWCGWNTSAVGDWVEYDSDPAPDVKSQTRMEVFDLGGGGLIIQVTSTLSVGGMETKVQSMVRYIFSEPEPPPQRMTENQPKLAVRDDAVSVAGRRIRARRTETEVGGKTVRNWSSDEIPCGGLVKSEFDGKLTMQLTGFGRGR